MKYCELLIYTPDGEQVASSKYPVSHLPKKGEHFNFAETINVRPWTIVAFGYVSNVSRVSTIINKKFGRKEYQLRVVLNLQSTSLT